MSRRRMPMGNKMQRERDKARKKREKEARREARLGSPGAEPDDARPGDGDPPAGADSPAEASETPPEEGRVDEPRRGEPAD